MTVSVALKAWEIGAIGTTTANLPVLTGVVARLDQLAAIGEGRRNCTGLLPA
jgi:hypothetical protein